MVGSNLAGQWLGLGGDAFPRVILDLDPSPKGYRGTGYAFSQVQTSPSGFFQVEIGRRSRKTPYRFRLRPFDERFCKELSRSEVDQYFPKANFQDFGDFQFTKAEDDILLVRYNDGNEQVGEITLRKVKMPKKSVLEADDRVHSWETFKNVIEELDFGEFAFRGQSAPYPLQTSFHRTNRKDLRRFLYEDMPALHRRLTGVTRHIFNLEIPQELGAFLSLSQHHGYPTPLLDWTYSPFIAAWFAYSDLKARKPKRFGRGNIRVYCLNKAALSKLYQFNHITLAPPHTSILESLPIENNRAIPQQGLLMLTNLQDVEAHLFNLEQSTKLQLLTAYDLPCKEVDTALADLAKMGITQSTMMPGIDSICLDMRSRSFR